MRLHSPAMARNIAPIMDCLAERLPSSGEVLEVASGPGEHVVALATRFPDLSWQPSDVSPQAIVSTDLRVEEAGSDNVHPALLLDLAGDWAVLGERRFSAMLAVNVCHISPFAATEGLLTGAARVLKPGGALFIYGPFKREGQHTAPSNAQFDASLRTSNPAWGVRDLGELDAAAPAGLVRTAIHTMPANNLVIEFRQAGSPAGATRAVCGGGGQ